MDQAIDGSRRGHRIFEYAFPFAEDQVAGDQYRSPFIALGDKGEEDLGLFGALLDVANFVKDGEFEAVQPAQLREP